MGIDAGIFALPLDVGFRQSFGQPLCSRRRHLHEGDIASVLDPLHCKAARRVQPIQESLSGQMRLREARLEAITRSQRGQGSYPSVIDQAAERMAKLLRLRNQVLPASKDRPEGRAEELVDRDENRIEGGAIGLYLKARSSGKQKESRSVEVRADVPGPCEAGDLLRLRIGYARGVLPPDRAFDRD